MARSGGGGRRGPAAHVSRAARTLGPGHIDQPPMTPWPQWLRVPRRHAGTDVAALQRRVGALTEEVGELGRQARTDPLTGLANRRGWDEQLDRELAQARRSGRPVTVALLALDDFKGFNDAHGHQA